MKYDVKRVERFLFQEARRRRIDGAKAKAASLKTQQLIEICGEFSQNRAMALRIGERLLKAEGSITVLCPVCINYGNVKRSMTTVGSFLEKHRAFFKRACDIEPAFKPTFFIPNHEVLNETIRRTGAVTLSELTAVLQELQAIAHQVTDPEGWRTTTMLDLIPDIAQQERNALEILLVRQDCEKRITAQTRERWHMYMQGVHAMDFEDMKLRTAQAAAQYIVLGGYAASHNMLICNHSTTSLRWYRETSAGVLNNPITLG